MNEKWRFGENRSGSRGGGGEDQEWGSLGGLDSLWFMDTSLTDIRDTGSRSTERSLRLYDSSHIPRIQNASFQVRRFTWTVDGKWQT